MPHMILTQCMWDPGPVSYLYKRELWSMDIEFIKIPIGDYKYITSAKLTSSSCLQNLYSLRYLWTLSPFCADVISGWPPAVFPTSAFFLGEQQRVRDPRGATVTRPIAPAAVVPVRKSIVVPNV